MILRRLMTHVKAQDWFAVALDFLIVVMGVFIGTQVANWNAARLDRERADGYLARIGADIAADLALYQDRDRFWGAVRGYGATALDYVETGAARGKSDWEVVLAFFQASQVAEFYTTNATFEELKSAGELGLIENETLRNRLAQYYGVGDNPALRERPRYREHVRGLIPLDVQSYIWTNCYASDSDARQSFIDCASPVEEARAASILAALGGAPELAVELRYWMSTMQVATIIARDRAASAARLSAEVKAAFEKERTR